MSNRTLLYISPEMPRLTGSGMAIRSASQILVLSELFDVSLAVVATGVSEEEVCAAIAPEVKAVCASIVVATTNPLIDRILARAGSAQGRVIVEGLSPLPLGYARVFPLLPALADKVAAAHPGHRFDVVQCFRGVTGRMPGLLRKRGVSWGRAVLDLDDYESFSKSRYVRQFSANIGRQFTALRRLEAWKLRRLEDRFVPAFDDAHVCSTADQAMLRARFPAVRWTVVPNVVPRPPPAARTRAAVFTFLFVGSLDYSPNRDAMLFFTREILPILRRSAPAPFRVVIAGRRPDAEIQALAELDGVDVVADPPALAPYSAEADVAIVPVRSGAGTRIKILEAFSFRVPVVSTELGAEGLELSGGTDLLFSDSAEDFA
ncbi:MAG TPA: glycosyltransferase family 4 protein, partial [Acetobacteraceae bacterium]|nr:glycosyltransferase family 4 protein [Acetobacteraceae bacterium]